MVGPRSIVLADQSHYDHCAASLSGDRIRCAIARLTRPTALCTDDFSPNTRSTKRLHDMSHHITVPDGFANWVLARRKWIILVISALTLACGYAIANATFRTSLLQALMPDDSQFLSYKRRAALLAGSSDDVVYVATREGDRLFTPKTLDAIRAARNNLESLPEIRQVFSLVDAPRMQSPREMSLLDRGKFALLRRQLLAGQTPRLPPGVRLPVVWPVSPKAQETINLLALRESLQGDGLGAGRFVSRDGQSQAILIRLRDPHALSAVQQATLRSDIETILKRHQLGRDGVYFAGVVVTQSWMFTEMRHAIERLLPIGALLISLLVYRIFGRLTVVLLTLVIAVTAILWGVGATAFAFHEITILVACAPLLILVISTADTIHLASACLTESESGLSGRDAMTKSIREVGGACLLTSITTFIGFLSLMIVPATAIRHLSLAMAVGVAGALLLALTLAPLALGNLRPRVKTGSGSGWRSSLIPGLLTGFVELCKWASLRHPKAIVGLHVVLIVAAGYSASQVELDVDFARRFPGRHPLRQSVDFFNRQFEGTNTIEVFVKTDPEALLTPDWLRRVAQMEDRIRHLPGVESTMSLVTLYRALDRTLDFGTDDGLPATQATANACWDLAETTTTGQTAGLASRENGLMRISVQVLPTRMMAVLDLSRDVEAIARESVSTGDEVDVTGFLPIIGVAAMEIVQGQFQGFGLCFVCVMITVTWGLRSWRLSLIAIVPNLLPLVLLGGLLSVTSDFVDTDVLGVAIISFGLAVDDTIHFLHRYDIEVTQTDDVRCALERTFDYTGRAIVGTTLILGMGLLPFALSGYLSIRILGTYLVFVLFGAVLADLLLLPALILLFDGRKPQADSRVEPA